MELLTDCQPLVSQRFDADPPAHRLQERPQPTNTHDALDSICGELVNR